MGAADWSHGHGRDPLRDPVRKPSDDPATVHSAEMVLTAGNGDEILATYEVIIDPFMPTEIGQKIVAEGTITFNGGTRAL